LSTEKPELLALRDLYGADDCGMIINLMIVEGQVHGGTAQRIGRALMEQIIYDHDGQLLTGSFMDHAIPCAGELPGFVTGETPAPSNPLGLKGSSESGTIGALAANRQCGDRCTLASRRSRHYAADHFGNSPARPYRGARPQRPTEEIT
jgi:Molybdopterin-binding domain of aldehyde dehydrogenase